MITVQMNVCLHCANPKCNETKHYSGYFPLGATTQDIFHKITYNEGMTYWNYRESTGELFCSMHCEDEVHGES